jgi:phage replication O-like protein O
MANPQPDKYTKISNELIEHGFYKFRLPGECWQILWFIIRKTYGFKKKEDQIAQSQIVEATGIMRQNVSRAIKKLKEMNVVYVIKTDYNGAAIIGLNKDYEKWSSVIKTDYKKSGKDVIKNATRCNQNGLQNVIKTDAYKRNKERKKEKPRSARQKDNEKSLVERQKIFKYDCAAFLDKFGKEMIAHFYDYWREPNKSKTKMRWERETTWDLNLRLLNWERMQKQRNGNKVNAVIEPGSVKFTKEQMAESDRIKEYLIREAKERMNQ